MCNKCFTRMKNELIMSGPSTLIEAIRKFDGNYNTINKCPAMAALERLTPGGSEFWEDAEFCWSYIRRRFTNLQDIVVNQQKQLNECNALREEAEHKLITLVRPNGDKKNGGGNGK